MSTALGLYQGVVRFMNAGIGMQPSRKDELVASQRVHLVTAWSRLSTIAPDDSSAVLEALSGDTDSFPRDVRASLAGALLDIVTSRSASNASSEVRSKKQQAVPTLYRYLPESRWSILKSQETMENKMRHLVDFMQDVLGVRRADEPTRVLAVSLTHVASNLTPTPDAAYEHVRLLSRIMVAKRGTTHGVETMQRLPDLPSDFMRLFPNAYKPDDHPVECRVSVGHILARCRPDTCPSRNSSSSVHAHGHRASSSTQLAAVGQHRNEPAAASAETMFRAMMSFMTQGAGAPPDVPLTFMQRRGTVGNQTSGAILDFQQSSPQSSPARSPSPEAAPAAAASMSSVVVRPDRDVWDLDGPEYQAPPPPAPTHAMHAKAGDVSNLRESIRTSIQAAESASVRKDGFAFAKSFATPRVSKRPAADDGATPSVLEEGLGEWAPPIEDDLGPREFDAEAGPSVRTRVRGKRPPSTMSEASKRPASPMSIALKRPATATIVSASLASTPKLPIHAVPVPRVTDADSIFQRIQRKSIHKDPALVAMLRAAPALGPRPRPSKEATSHGGGKIYWSDQLGLFRIYTRVGDRHEQRIACNWNNPAEVTAVWALACAVCERDPRPVR